jgi:hypothetical protein
MDLGQKIIALETQIREMRLELQTLANRVAPSKSRPEKSHFDTVLEVLRTYPTRWMTAGEITDLAGIDGGAVRMVLYGDKRNEKFISQRVGPHRVKWRLAEGVVEEEIAEQELAEV